jgi:Acyl-CoA synthetases (AMP-forming)/AMP-acid ligases II
MSTKALTFAARELSIERRTDGTLVLSSPLELGKCDWRITDFLPSWAHSVPDRMFLAQRNANGKWDEITYGEAWSQVQAVGQSLIEMGAKPADKLAILSGNSIENAVISFAAMSIGVIIAPISPNYTLMPGGLARLKDIAEALRPISFSSRAGATFPQDARFPNWQPQPGSVSMGRRTPCVSAHCHPERSAKDSRMLHGQFLATPSQRFSSHPVRPACPKACSTPTA